VKQLNVFCEGPTEQGFCAQVLRPHLFPLGDGLIHTLAVGEKDHHHVYGIGKYTRVSKFIQNKIKQSLKENVYFTTLIDLYALPTDFPGRDSHQRNPADPTPYVEALEESFQQDIDCHHFIPHLQLHEYETILLADPEAFRVSFEHCDKSIERLKVIAGLFESIEHIDDGPNTAPSKRIIEVVPEYAGRKATAGPDIAEHIGLPTIRRKCPHFDKWLTKLGEVLRSDEATSPS
jgi:hypothetical protein